MITDISDIKDQIEAISDLLLIWENQPKTIYITSGVSFNDMMENDLKEWYKTNFASLPLYTEYKNDELTIHHAFFQCYHKHHKQEQVPDEQNTERIREITELERDGVLFAVNEYVQERIHNFFYNFAQHIEELKKHPAFACLNEPVLILNNLLNHYVEIRQSENLRLTFFHHLTLPKQIADHITDFLILLLSDRIMMLDPVYAQPHIKTPSVEATVKTKIKWLSKQQEFAELIHTLVAKRYIQLPDISLAAQARFFDEAFDFSTSKRKITANTANNLLTYLKPIQDEVTKQTTYSYLKANYKKQFDGIVDNNPVKNK